MQFKWLTLLFSLFFMIVLPANSYGDAGENLLRNGSFEGGLLYWHDINADRCRLVQGDGVVGDYSMCIKDGHVLSAPFVAKYGEAVTVSFFVKGSQSGEVHVQMPPSSREDGMRAKRLWTSEATKVAKVSKEWSRVSLTWLADVAQSGFWPNPHYMVQIGTVNNNSLFIDGVTVTLGDKGSDSYIPRSDIEVVSECLNLPGYEGAKGNIFERGATAEMVGHISNPCVESRRFIVKWQLFDYEGTEAVSDAVEKEVLLDGNSTVSITVPMELVHVGCVIARISVLSLDGVLIDSSDFPLTSLPYPKSATIPNPNERFGGSFAGGVDTVKKFQRLGFGWIRWRPHANGRDHLPIAPKSGEDWQWHWFDKELDEQESLGCSSHICLYPPPDWIMEGGNPLPKDMRWSVDDPRWEDLDIETVWDKFVVQTVSHYRGRSVIYEIENEPGLNRWNSDEFIDEYAKFTIRTARLIRRTDSNARIMINNVYGIPNRVNSKIFHAGGLKYIDVISWHDYHEGWLADSRMIRRMRQNIDEAGGEHVEIWFNEGWAYTNTLVDEPIACTSLSSVESCNAIMDSVAEMTVSGQEKTILFHTAYEHHGMSFWDYSGPGTMLWDWYNYPLPLVAAWNVFNHHIGLSDAVGFVRPVGANFCIFQDQRNGRGVMIAYADRDAKSDVVVKLPDFGDGMVFEDIMGNVSRAGDVLKLSKSGRAVILYSENKVSGKEFFDKLISLDRKNVSFVSRDKEEVFWKLPLAWDGKIKNKSDGSAVMDEGKVIWKLEQIWPPDPRRKENYRPMVWTGVDWNVVSGGYGGQPEARLKDNSLVFGTRAAHGNPLARRICGLSFVAPFDGFYKLEGNVQCHLWDGNNRTVVRLFHKSSDGIKEVGNVIVDNNSKASLDVLGLRLYAGDEFTLVPEIDGMYAGGNCTFHDLVVKFGSDKYGNDEGLSYTLPYSWDGVDKGSSDGNPIKIDGKPVWRIDRVYPDEYIYTKNYSPIVWDGIAWHPVDYEQGGQPSVRVENGNAKLSIRGAWSNSNFQKIAGIVFIAPQSGVYHVRGVVKSNPWEGKAVCPLSILKKDAQRAVQETQYELPSDGSGVEIDFKVELNPGHELVFLPLMPEWHNATTVTIEGLVVEFVVDK